MSPPNQFGEILLVEDNPADVRLTKELLAETEVDPTVHVVADGAEALEFLHQSGEYRTAPRPDAILLDLHLPRMDGEEVLAEMDDDLRNIPVIVLSGSQPGTGHKLNDLDAEIAGCVEKPIEPEILENCVESVEEYNSQ